MRQAVTMALARANKAISTTKTSAHEDDRYTATPTRPHDSSVPEFRFVLNDSVSEEAL